MRGTRAAIAAATIGTLTGGALLAAPSAVAAGDTQPPVVHAVNVTPEPVKIFKTSATRVTVLVRASDDVGVTGAEVELHAKRDGQAGGVVPLRLVQGTRQSGTWRGVVYMNRHDVTGAWLAAAFVGDAAGNDNVESFDERTSIDYFWVKRNTQVRDFNVVEPATRGSYLRMSGRLVRLSERDGYVGFGGRSMTVWFKKAGMATWTKVGSVTTSSTGSFANTRRFRARSDGTWRVSYAGSPLYLARVSSRDFVDVR